ncbi:MAG: aconitate hydratase AcnA [Candidatus Omnitrophica bacterium]|nr:aconitate hydratase AcnA [Candidatus Omnitrophota bacterium]
MALQDPFGTVGPLTTRAGKVQLVRLNRLAEAGVASVDRLPFSLKVLLESLLRNLDGFKVTGEDVSRLAKWAPQAAAAGELPFIPARVILQDFTGVPCLVDLAAMRSALRRAGGDPKRINPLVPCDLVIDHSVQVDAFGSADALAINARMEFERNGERYQFLRWGSKAFANFRLVPPATGIVHQVNLEFLAQVVMTRPIEGQTFAFPDTLVGTDSHTTMINGLGVLGWGVGGIEAEAVMLGQPMVMQTPAVIGFKLTGRLPEGATATDLVLTVTQLLRAKGVVDRFIEFFGPGLSTLPLPDRATISNMCPEYGATAAYFPVDQETLEYLRLTGRPPELIDLVERYTKEQGLFRTEATPPPEFTEVIELDLGTVEPSLAGPKRPQDRVSLKEAKAGFQKALASMSEGKGPAVNSGRIENWLGEGGSTGAPQAPADLRSGSTPIGHGSVVIAAITSCTNTSNPSVMIGAGLLAKKAVERGLTVKPHVKTSLAPGSRVVTEYLQKAGLTPYLEKLGFYTVGYGCTTCIGQSGPLPEPVSRAVKEKDLVVASVLSGNRNFEGRIHPLVKANYLASPMLVVAYAIAGRVDIDLTREPLGIDSQGKELFLKEIWPTQKEIAQAILTGVTAEAFRKRYSQVFEGTEEWKSVPTPEGDLYAWSGKSTYIQEPPYFLDFPTEPPAIQPIRGARVLEFVGDSITTDHISPAGSIAKDSPAGRYLISLGVDPGEFNSYGARRGNDRVMARGTFANVRIKNSLAPDAEGWWTTHLPSGEKLSVFDAAERYKKEGTPLIVLAGKEYGSGSSRDWAAKGPALLGVKAVIAESFERIHRSNLVGVGILPLEFPPGESAKGLGLTGKEVFDLPGLDGGLKPRQALEVKVTTPEGKAGSFQAKVRIDNPVEIEVYRHGGILPYVLRKFLKGSDPRRLS